MGLVGVFLVLMYLLMFALVVVVAVVVVIQVMEFLVDQVVVMHGQVLLAHLL